MDDGPELAANHERAERPRKRARTQKAGPGGVFPGGEQASRTSVPATGGKQVKRRRLTGRLSLMMSMPVDVFCEIAHRMSPEDLLQMARSSKVVRDLLMSKDSKSIWRAAEQAVGLPACPPDLSSPQYASLLFDKYCMSCGGSRTSRFDSVLRIRLCKKCFETTVCFGVSLRREITENESIEMYLLLPGNESRYSVQENEKPVLSYLRRQRYFAPDFFKALRKYLSLASDPDARKKLAEEKQNLIPEIVKHSRRLDVWVNARYDERAKKTRISRANHKDSVFKKLLEIGYANEDFESYRDERGWKWGTLVNQSRELTERTWKTIRPHLEETIRLRRAKRERQAKESRQWKRKEALIKFGREMLSGEENKRCLILIKDLLRLPLATAIIVNDQLGTEVTVEMWEPIKDQLNEIGEPRMQEVEAECIAMILPVRREAGLAERIPDPAGCSSSLAGAHGELLDTTLLEHATTFFHSTSRFPEGIISFCEVVKDIRESLWYAFTSSNELVPAPDASGKLNRFLVDRKAVKLADALLVGLMFPANSTMAHMKSFGESFVCLCCDPILRVPLSWAMLVHHFMDEDSYLGFNYTATGISLSPHHDLKNLRLLASLVKDEGDMHNSEGDSECDERAKLSSLIRACECDVCSSADGPGLLNGIACQYCVVMRGLGGRFGCRGKLDAHLRTRHGLPVGAQGEGVNA